MLTDLIYLFSNRERPNKTRRWAIVWIKRWVQFFPLMQILLRVVLIRQKGAEIGELVILGHAKFQGYLTNLQIDDQVSLGRCEIILHDKVTIGRCVVINDGALVLTASHSLRDPAWRHKKAPIVIGDYAWIASNAIVLPGVTVGRGAVVGAGAVVRDDVPDYGVMIGNPAQLAPQQRTNELSYSPVMLHAPFEAWVGPARLNTQGVDTA